MQYNSQINKIIPSASMAKGLNEISVKANLAVGSPDIPPGNEIFELAMKFAQTPVFGYVQTKGSSRALKNIHHLVFNQNPRINPEMQISLCPGAKFGIYLSLKTITNQGDQVMLLQPYWLSYPDICISLGLNWSGFELDEVTLGYNITKLKESLIQNKSKVLILNNPNNPSGLILDKVFLEEMIEFCEKNKIWVLLDEVYKDLTFEKITDLHEWIINTNVIRVGSVSKSLSIPGMRIGYVQGSALFIHNFNLFNQHISTCINSFAMYLAEHISKDVYESYTRLCSKTYKHRFQIASAILSEKGFEIMPGKASFYLMVKTTPNYLNTSDAISQLEKKGIIVTEGESYGLQFKNYIRVCMTLPVEKLTETLLEF